MSTAANIFKSQGVKGSADFARRMAWDSFPLRDATGSFITIHLFRDGSVLASTSDNESCVLSAKAYSHMRAGNGMLTPALAGPRAYRYSYRPKSQASITEYAAMCCVAVKLGMAYVDGKFKA